MNHRYLFTHASCNHCPKIKSVIPKINSRLKPENRIIIIDVASEDFGINMHAITKRVNFENVPFLYLDGICKEGVTSETYAKNYIEQHLRSKGEID